MKPIQNLLLILTAAALSLPGAYASGRKDVEKPVTVNAQVVMFGTAPGLFPGLVTNDGKLYSIKIVGTAVTMPDLLSHTGQLLVCTGRIELPGPSTIGGFEVLKDGTFLLSAFHSTDSGVEHK